jgi:hypothetical protein
MAELIANELSAFVDRLQGVDEDSACDDETVHYYTSAILYIFYVFFKNNDTDLSNTFEITDPLKQKYQLNCADWISFQHNCRSAG